MRDTIKNTKWSKKISWQKCLPILLWGVLLACFLVTRLYRLSELPGGLHVDEVSAIYDAWCLKNFGVDRHLKSWPVYFLNYGGGQNALYTWICAGLFSLFDYSAFLTRLPMVVSMLLTMIYGARLAMRLYPNWKWTGYAVGALITFCPCFVLISRFGLESYLMLGTSTVFLYYFQRALEEGKYSCYIAAGVWGGIMLYSYAISYLALLTFLIVSLVYAIIVRRFHIKKWVVMSIPLGILAFPLILVQAVNYFDLPEMHMGIFTITKFTQYRIDELTLPTMAKITAALRSAFVGDFWISNSIPAFWNFFKMTAVLFVVGFVSILVQLVLSLKRREPYWGCLMLFWFLCVFWVVAATYANVNRINGIFFSVIAIALEGIGLARILKNKWLIRCAALALTILYLRQFGAFAQYYYGGGYEAEHHPIPMFEYLFDEPIIFLDEHPECAGEGSFIVLGSTCNTEFYAFSLRLPPHDIDFNCLDVQGYHLVREVEIEEPYNYIVADYRIEYLERLRGSGFKEKQFDHFSVFYLER